ncbi:class I SAM-dependent methyltransferase [Allosphingosinicella sp.]|uniref:class I SAM-dependent methyltransferase n=1 Tax=Allosphingosinicella sp. TaxID=2823234 RepID=UPI003783B7D1
MASAAINDEKFGALMGKALTDIGGAFSVLMAYVGDRLGLYQALKRHGPGTSAELAAEAGLDERYVREWLSCVASAGHLEYDPATTKFTLSPEAELIYAAEGDPRCLQGFFQAVKSAFDDEEKSVAAIKAGRGLSWGDRSPCCFCGTDRFFRPGYALNLVDSWIPSLSGIREKLEAGAKVADIGCGHGSSTILMAQAFPNSHFTGFDFHPASIDAANEKREEAGLDNVTFEVAAAKTFPGTDYEFICIFDAIHDMGDPVGAAAHIRQALKPDGSFMVVEPLAGDALEENLHLLGTIFYGFSTLACVPASKAQEVGLALGAQAGQKRLSEVLMQGGFNSVRRAAQTDTNMVLEARA